MPADCPILIFAKAPQPGEVKTRLIPALGKDGAAGLYRQLLRHAITQACKANTGPVELWCSPDAKDTFFTDCANQYKISLHIQHGKDLGEKMSIALNDVLTRAPQALLIGSDCPMLDTGYLRQAATVLSNNQSVVISPTEDGGYALIGTTRKNLPIFEKVEWSSERVMAQTRQILQAANIHWLELPQVWDVDTPTDLPKLRTLPEFALAQFNSEVC